MLMVNDISGKAKQALRDAGIEFAYDYGDAWRVKTEQKLPFAVQTEQGKKLFVLVDHVLFLREEFPEVRLNKIRFHLASIRSQIDNMYNETDVTQEEAYTLRLLLDSFEQQLQKVK